MKKYFAKYLPVEGEIKKGDLFFNKDSKTIVVANSKTNETGEYWGEGLYTKVKLFLCSRDIQVGDKIWWENHDNNKCSGFYNIKLYDEESDSYLLEDNESEGGVLIGEICKVVGEISPEATWVKEGDEFDECQIRAVCQSCGNYGLHHPTCKNKDSIHYEILGPCKHSIFITIKVEFESNLGFQEAIEELQSESFYTIESTENVVVTNSEWLDSSKTLNDGSDTR